MIAAADSDRAGLHAIVGYGGIAISGGLLWFGSTYLPADMPAVAPYSFSWPIWLATTVTAFWYLRGLSRLDRAASPPVWRRVAFAAGLVLIYAVVHTGFEYLAQRMFFINRLQHVAMHHAGPMLLGLSAAGPVILAGAPDWLRRASAHRVTGIVMGIVQQPAIAGLLFVGLFFFWIVPPVHFVAMIDPLLYQVMNWSMVVDGILFWALVLDRRPAPPARTGFLARAALSGAVMFPQIVGGALITFANVDLFPYYAFCGRVFPQIGAVADQQLGGLVIWLPPAMMSILGILIVVANLFRTAVAGR